MVIPKLKRVNTIGIRFTKGDKTPDILDTVIVSKLGIPKHELAGLANYGPKKHMIKVKTLQMYEHLVLRYVGYPIRVDNDHEIEVDDLSSYKDRVKVTRVPFEMSRRTLKDLLGRYGQVDNVIRSNNRERQFKDIPTDEFIAWMTVSDPIPSSLWIAETEQYMFFSYHNQPQTCNNCGDLSHKASRCDVYRNTEPKDRSNAVNVNIDLEDEIPEQNVTGTLSEDEHDNDSASGDSAVAEDDENESDDDNESISSNQEDSNMEDNDTNFEDPFSCPECDFKAYTVHELTEHKKVHKDSYATRVKAPVANINLNGSNTSRPKSPGQHAQTNEISWSQPVRSSNYEHPCSSNNKKGEHQ